MSNAKIQMSKLRFPGFATLGGHEEGVRCELSNERTFEKRKSREKQKSIIISASCTKEAAKRSNKMRSILIL